MMTLTLIVRHGEVTEHDHDQPLFSLIYELMSRCLNSNKTSILVLTLFTHLST